MKTDIINIEKLLSSYLDGNKIAEIKMSPLTSPGEHYGSIILAVDIKIRSIENNEEETCRNLVAKLIPSNEMLRKVFDIDVTFNKEIFFYTTTIPALVEFQREYKIPEEKYYVNLFPKCFGARLSANELVTKVDDTAVIILENLKAHGYFTEDRLKGYNLQAAMIVLKNLAKFHATPIALKLIKPLVFEEKVEPCLMKNKGIEQMPEIAELFNSAILEGAKDCSELNPYMDKIQSVCENRNNNSYRTSLPSEPWATISHNDFWTSNSMVIKDAAGNCIESKIIDFQLSSYHSPLHDIVFFLLTSVINEDLDKHFDDFIKIYFDCFIETLIDFNVDVKLFSWTNFQKELDLAAKQQLYHILVMLKPICTERGKVQNAAENFVDTDWTRQDLLGPNHRRKLKDTILFLVKRNWL